MTALHRLPTATTTALVDAKLNPFHARRRNLCLVLRNHPGLLHPAPTVRTLRRQGNFYHLVDYLGNLPPMGKAVLLARFPSRFFGMSLGLSPRKRRRLSLGRPQRLF
jgi:hypothetical protein